MKYIHGIGGKILGRIHESGSNVVGTRKDVYGPNNEFRGWTDDNGTFDKLGRRISRDQLPGLLIDKDDD